MKNNFLPKLMTNLLASYECDKSEEFLFAELLDRRPGIDGKWVAKYKKIKDTYINRLKRSAKGEVYFVRIVDYLTRDLIAGFIKDIKEEFPEIDNEWDIQENTKLIGEMLELTKNELIVLELAIQLNDMEYSYCEVFENLRFSRCDSDPYATYSRLFNFTTDQVKDIFNGFLIKSGFLEVDETYKCLYRLNEELDEIFHKPFLTLEGIEESLFPSNLETSLTLDLYPHIKEEIGITENIINRSLTSTSKGMNVMFWGFPGTGKTELALALAKKNNWNLKVIGDISESDTNEKSRAQRLTSLKIAMKMFKRRENIVLLFDEMEDLFKDDKNENFSKAFINRIIETTTIPIIWTTNNLDSLGRAVLRRMVYNISFRVPNSRARKLMWENYNNKYELKLPEETIEELSFTYDMVPALINNAAKIASMAGLPLKDIPQVLKSLDTLMNYGYERRFTEGQTLKDTPYDLGCLNTSLNKKSIAGVEDFLGSLLLAKSAFSLCFYGPPGTGKSEFGRYIAKQLHKRVLYKRASDLISMWVGETEKNIAAAFAEAKECEMVLIIDEGDTFLRSRETAQRSWEVSQVNEMLSQMEMHTQPFILTTNLMKDLDQASLRRFTFKVEFDFLQPEQAARLFKVYFKHDAPNGILKNYILTPGDFATVLKKSTILGIDSPMAIYNMLSEECDMKPQKTKEIGFI